MKTRYVCLGAILNLIGMTCVGVLIGRAQSPQEPHELFKRLYSSVDFTGTNNSNFRETYGNLPLSFEPNVGQTSSQVQFLAHTGSSTLFLTPQEAVISLGQSRRMEPRYSKRARLWRMRQQKMGIQSAPSVLRIRFLGAASVAQLHGLSQLPGKVNYFVGNNPDKWQTQVPTYSRVEYQELYPGIDLQFYGNQGRLEYDFVVNPQSDPRRIALSLDGADQLRMEADGSLQMKVGDHDIELEKPLIYQVGKGGREEVAGHYVLTADSHIKFDIGRYDQSKPLIIDPVVIYSTYLGGSVGGGLYSFGTAIAVDSNGDAFVAGGTETTNFPTTSNALQSTPPGGTVNGTIFVSEINPTGTALLYSTYIGGNQGEDTAWDIALDNATPPNVYVVGESCSTNYPTTSNAYQTSFAGCNSNVQSAIVITKFNPAVSGLSAISYSTYIAGNGTNVGYGEALDSSGDIYITGLTNSSNFPVTTNALQSQNKNSALGTAFVTRIDPTKSGAASLIYSSYLGGSGGDLGYDVRVDSNANAYVTGSTGSSDFPTTASAFMQSPPPDVASGTGFVARIDTSGGSVVYSTFIGGSGSKGDVPGAIALDQQNRSYITGNTCSSDYPITAGAFDATAPSDVSSQCTGMLSIVDTSQSGADSLIYSTFLGGSGGSGSGAAGDIGLDVVVDSTGHVYIDGWTYSPDFPVTQGAYQTAMKGVCASFVSELLPLGNGAADLVYSTYFDGTETSGACAGAEIGAWSIALDSNNHVYITGLTSATDFPIAPSNAFQTSLAGAGDAYIAKLALSPQVLATPTISSLSENSGATGTTMTISGNNFNMSQGSGSVMFGSVTASVDSWSSTSIVALVPSEGTPGSVQVAVRTLNGTSNTQPFTVIPSITTLNPSSGPVGASVTISGYNFGSSGTVTFNGQAATTTSWSSSTVVATVPSSAATGNVIVTSNSTSSAPGTTFTVVPTPTITGLSINSGTAATQVTITGTNFGSSQQSESGSVLIGGASAFITSWSGSSITALVPNTAAPGSGSVTVTAGGVQSNAKPFTVNPSVFSIAPYAGPAGTSIVINGANFGSTQSGGTVNFGTSSGTVSSWTSTALTVAVPSLSAGAFAVTVTAASITTNSVWFTVTGASGSAPPANPPIPGLPAFGSFAGGPDQIDLGNLNIHLDVPVYSRPGRGTSFRYTLKYDSSIYYPSGSPGNLKWQPVNNWGWAGQSSVVFGSVSYALAVNGTCSVDSSQYTIYYGWTYQDNFGVPHPFNVGGVSTDANCGSRSQTGTATDGSGYTLSLAYSSGALSASVASKAGRQFNAPINGTGGPATYTDRNGNQISVNSSGVFTDTLGTTVLTASGSAPSPVKFAYTPPAGGTAYVTVTYKNYSIQTGFGCTSVAEYSNSSVSLVDRVTYQDGTFYQFNYEHTPGSTTTYSGRLTSVTLPTGGTLTYHYQGSTEGISCADGTTTGFKRFTPDTGSSKFWSYTRTLGSGAASTTTVTDPTSQANQTLIQFQGIYETQRQTYQGSSTLLRTIATCYNGNTTSCTSTAVSLPILQRNVTTQLPGTNNVTSGHIYRYDSNQNLLEEDDYDYGAGALGKLLKKTVISYASLGNNIIGFPQQATITDGSGNLASQTTYSYDQGSLTATTGTPQHVAVTGSRGNLTTTNTYVTASSSLTKSYTYFDTGNVQTATDVNGAQTTYTYGTGSCGNSFPTSVAEPLTLSRSTTWNCTGGVQTSVVDENGNSWLTGYTADPDFWRPNSKTDPTNAITTFTFTGATQVESVLPIVTGTSASDSLSTLDSMGRPHLGQIRQAPGGSNFDTTETDYDVEGRSTRATLPFQSTAGQGSSTAPGKTTSYDALGRIATISDSGGGSISNIYSQNDVVVTRGPAPTGENAKKHQSEYDALGRITSVCEMTSAQGTGSCAQNTAQNGFWTKYTYDGLGHLTGVTQNAQSSGSTQTRSYTYDLLGRMTSANDPETGNATYTYIYDTDSTCGTSKGDLVKRIDAVGNVACFTYDSLHRQLSITYPLGSYASKTSNKYFVYDSATVNGTVMVNVKTRLAEAYTCVSPCSTKLTDTGFSYTLRGEPSDVYESTPNSGGYYHVAEQYWANGGMKQLSGLSSLPTFTSNPDGEGRTSQVTASSGQNPVTNTVFNNASLPTSVTFGSSDTDSFTYDPNTDRMTQYQFTVNGQSLTGALTWNANSTLQALKITDALNSADTQSCSFAYDDLARLASTDCGTAWSQTYSYDAFGNISKAGSSAFQPTYSSSTNQITSVSGFTPTYDSNGNTLTDPSHTYSWDSAGKPVVIDAVNMTYDALGRMVEQNRSGAYTQFVYGPHGGKFAIFSGQTLQKAFVPLPGGAQVVYNANGILYYGHSDHLGSIRLGSTSSRTVSFDLAYAPFGETYASSGSTDPAFTGQREDTVVGLFDFPGREYNPQGRWPSADPSGLAAFHLTDPQSFNRYAYARNTPLSVVDPTGLILVDISSEDPFGGGGGGDGFGGGGGGDFGGDGGDPVGSGDPGSGSGQSGADGGQLPPPPDILTSPTPCSDPSSCDPLSGALGNQIAGPNNMQFSSAQEAAAFGSIYAYWQATGATDNGEWGGEVYQNANGTYSFDVGRPSDPNNPDYVLIDPNAIPDGTTFSGFYHTHGDDPSGSLYFTPDDNTLNGRLAGAYGNYQGMSVSLSNGDILWRTSNGLQKTVWSGVGP